MNTDRLLDTLGRANPVPDSNDLIGSDVADELASRKPDSVLDWTMTAGEYRAKGYRIHLLGESEWEITHKGTTLGSTERLTWAFSVAELHRGQAIRRRDLIRHGLTFLLAILAGGAIIAVVDEAKQLYLWVAYVLVFSVTVGSSVRFYAALTGTVDDPYRRLLWWERRRRWRERLFVRR